MLVMKIIMLYRSLVSSDEIIVITLGIFNHHFSGILCRSRVGLLIW
jgi:hypothetical protein